MDDIQSWWEVPSIAHFCSLFRAAFNLLDFDIEELEEALLTDGAEDSGSSLLQELIVRLLCGCLGNNDISTFNFQMFLRRLFRQKCQEYGRENPFNTDMDFQFLPLRTKVEILHTLCDFRLDADDVQDLLKNLESDSLRVEPLGYDENHSAYWYFYGTRLYREDFPKIKRRLKEKRKKNKEEKHRKKHSRSPPESDTDDSATGASIWQVVCFTEDDWDKVTESFRHSTSKSERALYHTLAEDFLPEIPRLFAEKERLQRKRLLEYQPRRQSSRLEKLKQQKVEEERLLQREGERQKNEQEQKERITDKQRRAHRALKRSLSGTNSECGSTDSAPDSRKFVGRQTNNSLSSATGQIVIQGLRRKLRSSQVFKQTEEDLQTGMYKILEHIKNHEDAWPFSEPVDEKFAPQYYSVISQPMDLQKMEDKLDEGEYLSLSEFKADFQLIIDNCRKYNGVDNEYTEMAKNLQEAFQLAVDRYFESDQSSDEEIAVEYPKRSNSNSPLVKKKKSVENKSLPHNSSRSASPGSQSSAEESSDSEKNDEQKPTQDAIDSEDSSEKPETPHSNNRQSRSNSKKRKKSSSIKNAADIEALALATEQTLKDINKWLDDTPRFSEFSSASNSPSHFVGVGSEDYEIGSRIENEYRQRLKIDRQSRFRDNREVSKRRSLRDIGKLQRRREVQLTIDRLQPGKSKGNLISCIQNANKAADESSSLNKTKDNRVVQPDKESETAPKLSLGTVLAHDVLSFGKFEENSVCQKTKDDLDESSKHSMDIHSQSSPESLHGNDIDVKKENEEATVKVTTKDSKQEKITPNYSAWLNAFGGPKNNQKRKLETSEHFKQEDRKRSPSPLFSELPLASVNDKMRTLLERSSGNNVKKVTGDTVKPSVENKFSIDDPERRPEEASPLQHQLMPRQRRVSTGSSISERSSFSQDMMDPLDGSSPRLSVDERYGGYPAPFPSPRGEDASKMSIYPPPPNGTIRVGFYQDTSSSLHKSSPEKNSSSSSSPRDVPSAVYGTYNPRMYAPPHDPGGFSPYPSQSSCNTPPSRPVYSSLSSFVPYYDTSKPLTDQYQAARTQSSSPAITTSAPTTVNDSPIPGPPAKPVKPASCIFPVKKRLCNEIDANSRLQLSQAVEQHQSEISEELPSPVKVSQPDVAAMENSSSQPLPQDLSVSNVDREIEKNMYINTLDKVIQNSALRVESSPIQSPNCSPGKLPARPQSIILSSDPNKNVLSSLKSDVPLIDRPSLIAETAHKASVTSTIRPVMSDRIHQNVPPIRTGDIYHRSPFSPMPPTSLGIEAPLPLRGNFPGLSHIVERYTADERSLPSLQPPPGSFFNEKSLAASHLFSQNPQTTLQSPIPTTAQNMFSQASPSGMSMGYNHEGQIISPPIPFNKVPPYNQSVSDLTTILSSKGNVQQHLNKSAPDIIPAKVSSPLGVNFNRPVGDLSAVLANKRSSPIDLQSPYNHVPTELSSVIPNKVSMSQHTSYNRVMSDFSGPSNKITSEQPSLKSRKRKSKLSSSCEVTCTTSGTTAFQQYASTKCNVKSSEPETLLKTSVVPGSAFNFGPATTNLRLYADKDCYPGFLDEYRANPSGYFLSPSESPREKLNQGSPPAPTSPFPFISHPQPRPAGYGSLAQAFINHHQPGLIDHNNPLYQQYLQRHQEEILRHSGNSMVLHQGLLAATSGGYPPGFHPTLGIRQHFDALNRPTWL